VASEAVTGSAIDAQIHVIRGMSVILDIDLAALYRVSPGALLQAVRRNRNRFLPDFLFRLTNQELAHLKSQSVISSSSGKHGGRRHRNWAFTEQGVAMLSSVIRSETAVRVNIEIMRAFVRLRRAAIVSEKVMALVEDLSKRVDAHEAVITDIVKSIRQMVEGPVVAPGPLVSPRTSNATTDAPLFFSGHGVLARYQVIAQGLSQNCDLKFAPLTTYGSAV
jgi:hypothetical protein